METEQEPTTIHQTKTGWPNWVRQTADLNTPQNTQTKEMQTKFQK